MVACRVLMQRWLLVVVLLPMATQGNDLGDPHLYGLDGASWFYRLGCQLEEEAMYGESLRSFQTSVRLVHEERALAGSDPKAAGEIDHFVQLIYNTSWEVKVRENAGNVGLGSSENVQVELLDNIGSLPVVWQLGENLQEIAGKVCCVGRDSSSDSCFDFGEEDHARDDGLADSRSAGSKRIAAAKAAGQSCSEYVHELLETAEHEIRDAARKVVCQMDGSESGKSCRPRPPRYMPAVHRSGYLQEVGAVQEYYYFDDSYESYYRHYGKEQLEAMTRLAARRKPGTNYADVDRILYALLDSPLMHIPRLQSPWPAHMAGSPGERLERTSLQKWLTGAAVVVVGSVVPWYEVLALQSGAAFTLTLEYNEVRYEDPRMLSDTPARYWRRRREARRDEAQDVLEQGACGIQAQRFDVGLSISSIEHAGLGRYGDPLDPHADLRAMHELEEIIRPDGLLILAVPVGKDTVMWNAHRVYGRQRLTLLARNWTVLGVHGMRADMLDNPVVPRRGEPQPVLLLQNARPERPADFSDGDDPVWDLVFDTGTPQPRKTKFGG